MGRSVFQQAGELQSTAATKGAAAEVGGIQQAIQQLMSLLSGGGESLNQASTIGGFGDRLNQIISGEDFGGLVEEGNRNLLGNLGAGGLVRSGVNAEASRALPMDLALGIENQLFGRESSTFGQQTGITQMIAQMLGLSGAVKGEGIRGAAEAEAGGILGEKGFKFQRDQQKKQNRNNTLGLIGTGIGGAVGGPFGAAIGGALGSVFSDPRLKENIRLEGKIGPLDLVRWDWIPEAPEIVTQCKTIGFMSPQVKEHFPDVVSQHGGYDVINYTELMRRLDG